MIIKSVIATTKPFENHGLQMNFSTEDLQRMADTAAGTPVTVNFNEDNRIGNIVSADVIDDRLICEIDIKQKPFGDSPSFLVPGTVFDEKSGIHKKMVTSAITLLPAQKDLPAL